MRAGRIAPLFTPFDRLAIGAKAYVTGVFCSSTEGKRSSPSIVVGIDLAMSTFFFALDAYRL